MMDVNNLNEIDRFRETQLRLLDAIKHICEKHDLRYWLDFGTLLGAVRHKGFIPWDDDVDVSMPIEDYKRFLEIAEKELPHDIFLQTSKTDKEYKQYFAKLRDCYSTFVEQHETDAHQYHKGIYVDIFPSVFYPRMPTLLRRVLTYVTVRSRYDAIVLSRHVWFNYPVYMACKFVWLLFSPFKSNKFAQTPEDNGYLCQIPIAYLYPLSEIEFEGRSYAGPAKPHEYLSLLFQDYMTPPPPEKRVPHAKVILPDTPCGHPRALRRNIY